MTLTPESLAAAAEMLNNLGLMGGLIIVLIGGFRRWWVFGWQFDAMQSDRDQWKALALRGTDIAARAVDVAISRTTP